MATKKKTTKKDNGLLSEILRDDYDREIESLKEEVERVSLANLDLDRRLLSMTEAWATSNQVRSQERDDHRVELINLQRSHQIDIQSHRDALLGKTSEIANLRGRFQMYASWVVGIKKLDLSPASADHMLPMDVALARVDTSLSLLYSSLKGETLEQAMQALGYIETVFGFEAPRVPKFIVQLVKTDGLYKSEEGSQRQPSSTQIYAIKELRQHLNIGLKDAKEITDTLYEGKPSEIEFSSREGAEKVAEALRICGYFYVAIIER